MRQTFVVTLDAKKVLSTDEIAEHLSDDDARQWFDVVDVKDTRHDSDVTVVHKGTPSYDLVKSVRGLIAQHVTQHEGERHPEDEDV